MSNMSMKTKIVNPLDELFETEEQVGMIEYEQATEGELAELQSDAPSPEIDAEDIEINKKIDDIYTAAYDTFQNQMAYTEIVEPRYAARNAEVAANYLNIALNAASVRAKVKNERKKQAAFVPYTGNRKDGTVVASREEIMKMISVDAEMKKV
jgi:hypothetical protein